MHRKEYSEFVKCSIRTAFSDLQELLEKNEYITFVGSKKTGYYQLKLPNKLPNKKNRGKKV